MPPKRTIYTPPALKWVDALPAASASVRVGDLLFISGQVSLDAKFRAVAAGDVKAQARNIFSQIQAAAEAAGGSLDDVLDLVSFHKDCRQLADVVEVASDFFKKDYPAWTAVGTSGTYDLDLLVSIKAIAHLGKEKKQCY